MQNLTKQIPSNQDRRVERAIVLQTLRDDHDKRWSQAELAAELDYADPTEIGTALTRLMIAGVIELVGDTIQATPAVAYLNELGMIAV